MSSIGSGKTIFTPSGNGFRYAILASDLQEVSPSPSSAIKMFKETREKARIDSPKKGMSPRFASEKIVSEEGEFYGNQLDGPGTRLLANGTRITGLFKEGILLKGTVIFDDLRIFEGNFDEGRVLRSTWIPEDDNQIPLNGKGKRVFQEGPIKSEEGYFLNGQLESSPSCYYHWSIPGKRRHVNGALEEGIFSSGKLSIGKVTYENQAIQSEKGPFDKDGKLHGRGVRTYDYGLFKEGLFLHGEFMGNYQQGSWCENIANNFLMGRCKTILKSSTLEIAIDENGLYKIFCQTLTDPRVITYVGQCEGKTLNGPGRISHGDKSKGYLSVIFKDFILDGTTAKGRFADPNGKLHEGTFSFGKLHGEGKRTYAYGKILSKEGTFKNGSLVQGTILFRDGATYEGSFSKTLSYGKKIFSQGDIVSERGNFHEGLLEKLGKRLFADGSIEEGNFLKGTLHGFGKRTSNEGKEVFGKFRYGHLLPK